MLNVKKYIGLLKDMLISVVLLSSMIMDSNGASHYLTVPHCLRSTTLNCVILFYFFCLKDEPGLGENYPTQTEMALVYQSAAWILAALLLAIIIFLIVALLINKKKKWVQMSCYSAPKKVRDHLKMKKNRIVKYQPRAGFNYRLRSFP